MSAKGVLAGINRAARALEREARRQERDAARRHAASRREVEEARREEERLLRELERADAREAKWLEKEAKLAHIESMEAEAADMNAALAEENDEIDSILAATLDVDDFVDLEALRQVAEHPPFDRPDLESAKPKPPLNLPTEPALELPPEPKGIFAFRRRYEKKVAKARSQHDADTATWENACAEVREKHAASLRSHAAHEAERLRLLDVEMALYDQACAEREAKATEANRELDQLVANLGYGTPDAVREYVAIVVSNSVYPDHFPVDHDFEFDPATAELSMRVTVSGPSIIRTEKEFKYRKSTDEIMATPLSQKGLKDRYSGAIYQVALRSLHEVFEADRRGLVKTMSVEVGANETDPATGHLGFILFVAAAASREAFIELDLSAVVPEATLKHLGSSVSKNPYGLVPARAKGVRKS